MITTEEKIRNWQKSVAVSSEQVAAECTATFLAAVPSDTLPVPADLERAAVVMQEQAVPLLASDETLAALELSDLGAKESLRASWLSLMPKLDMPAPSAELELDAWRLAAAGALGSLLGMFLIGGLLHWVLNMRDAGILLGGSVGAAALVYGVWLAAHNKTVRTGLLAFVGAATAFELFNVFSGIGFGGLWMRLTGAGSFVKRLLLYIAILALLAFIRPQSRYDRSDFERVVRHIIGQWINQGRLLLFSLANSEQHEIVREVVLDPALARSIVDLHKSSATDLALTAEAVLHEARRMGVDSLDGSPQFVTEYAVTKHEFRWEMGFSKQYRCFGAIEDGDMVMVEKEPIIQNEVIIDLGMVRKVRKSKKH